MKGSSEANGAEDRANMISHSGLTKGGRKDDKNGEEKCGKGRERNAQDVVLGLKQRVTALSETQLKVLKLGDTGFAADQFQTRKSTSPATEVVLGPGDVMYHPAGVWHRVSQTLSSSHSRVPSTDAGYLKLSNY
jgi:hypothetical protein